jgi:hypothetical protein
MLSAYALPVAHDQKYQIVAAIAIRTGAAGKEAEKSYNIERDTAALIAKMTHGDPFERGDGHWAIPSWYKGTQPTQPAPQQPKPVTPRTAPGRPKGDRQKSITKTLRYLLRHSNDGEWRGTIAELATAIKVARRTMQSYLHDLQTDDAIAKGQIGGNGPLIIIIKKSSFGGADNASAPAQNAVKVATKRGADGNGVEGIEMRQSNESPVQCIMEKETPRIPAPPSATADADPRPQGAELFGVSQPSITPTCEHVCQQVDLSSRANEDKAAQACSTVSFQSLEPYSMTGRTHRMGQGTSQFRRCTEYGAVASHQHGNSVGYLNDGEPFQTRLDGTWQYDGDQRRDNSLADAAALAVIASPTIPPDAITHKAMALWADAAPIDASWEGHGRGEYRPIDPRLAAINRLHGPEELRPAAHRCRPILRTTPTALLIFSPWDVEPLGLPPTRIVTQLPHGNSRAAKNAAAAYQLARQQRTQPVVV